MKRYLISNIHIDYGGLGGDYIPMYADYIGDLIGLGKYLGWR